MYYSLLLGEFPVYELDSNGNKIVDWTDGTNTYYRETGDKQYLYSNPVAFEGNIAMSGSSVDRVEFGIDEARYQAVLVVDGLPLTETSLIWFQTTPVTKTIDEKTYADESSADYRVLKVSPSLNVNRYILGKVVK